MTRRTFRWLGTAVAAIAGATLLSLMSMVSPALVFADDTALIMGGTTQPEPPPEYVTSVYERFIAPAYPTYAPEGLYTPEQTWPFTGLTSLTYDQSVAEGVKILDHALDEQFDDENNVLVFGYSQSASIATIVKRQLDALPTDQQPSPDHLAFVLIGNLNRPDGGVFERFDGLYGSILDSPYHGATPNDIYPTTDIALEYDGNADFPQYPIDIPADLNALLGAYYVHSQYQYLTPEQIASGVIQPVSPADLNTTYILIPTQNLPLLDPLRGIVPTPLLDLVQPGLRVIIDLGYDRTAPQDVPTPAGLFPNIDLMTVVTDLQHATVQGVDDALVDLGLPSLADPGDLSDSLGLFGPAFAELADPAWHVPAWDVLTLVG